MSCANLHGYVLGATVFLLPSIAGAWGPGFAATEREDDHVRPPEYDDPAFVIPRSTAADPEYPLATAFVPADPSNYTAGGIASFDYVVVHTMQGYYGGSISWFQNPAANVSAHYCMRSEDGEVTQMVRNSDRAWHVGNSNSYAIGIEHEGYVDDPAWYTWETYASSAELARWLCDTYEIPIDRQHVVGHGELPAQTHTDPGPLWNWDLYMALIHDVVSEGRIEGVVVDRDAACTITANTDTLLKATLEDEGSLDAGESCSITAGTSLTYYWASRDIYGHRRLTMAQDGPCAGLGPLDVEAFARPEHWDGMCEPADMVITDASVALDGAEAIEVGEAGGFAFDGVAAGAHTLDTVGGDGFEDGVTPIDVDVHPGARVVIVLDPNTVDEPDPDPTGPGDDGAGDTEPAPSSSDGDDPDDGGSSGSDPDATAGALPGGYGERGAPEGCGCRARDAAPGFTLALLPGLLLLRRRRRDVRR